MSQYYRYIFMVIGESEGPRTLRSRVVGAKAISRNPQDWEATLAACA